MTVLRQIRLNIVCSFWATHIEDIASFLHPLLELLSIPITRQRRTNEFYALNESLCGFLDCLARDRYCVDAKGSLLTATRIRGATSVPEATFFSHEFIQVVQLFSPGENGFQFGPTWHFVSTATHPRSATLGHLAWHSSLLKHIGLD
jgi:hypothetical protein